MNEKEQLELKKRYEAAVESFIEKVKPDQNVIAVIVCGSLAYDMVWEKSDIDMTMVVRDQVLKNRDYSIVEDDIIINLYIMTRSEFKRGMERNIGGSFSQSYMSKGKIYYTTDDSLTEYFEDIKKIGSDDIALSAFYHASHLVGNLEKCEKWLYVRKDRSYAQYFLLKTAEIIASLELCLNGEPFSRAGIQKAIKLNPEIMNKVYVEPMSRNLDEEELDKAIKAVDNYLMKNIEVIKKPVVDFMQDGELKTSTLIAKHFHAEPHFIIGIFEYLYEKGIIEKASQTIRITPKGRQNVEELGYIYLPY